MECNIQIVADAEALSRIAADVFVDVAKRAVRDRGRFTVALSGGLTPKALYSLLTGDPDLRAQVPWQQTYFFFGDERHVPPPIIRTAITIPRTRACFRGRQSRRTRFSG